jgi:hypothetical protein
MGNGSGPLARGGQSRACPLLQVELDARLGRAGMGFRLSGTLDWLTPAERYHGATRTRPVTGPSTTRVARTAVQSRSLLLSTSYSLCFASTARRARILTSPEIRLWGKGFRSPGTRIPAPEMATSRRTPSSCMAARTLRIM